MSIQHCPIQPSDIDTTRHFWDSFGKYEPETSANLIVRFCQKKGKWTSFTKKQIDKFTKQDFRFNGLTSRNYITKTGDKYSPTTAFVSRCYDASPATKCGARVEKPEPQAKEK